MCVCVCVCMRACVCVCECIVLICTFVLRRHAICMYARTYTRMCVILYDTHGHAHTHAKVRTRERVSALCCSISSKISKILSALSQAHTHHQENKYTRTCVCCYMIHNRAHTHASVRNRKRYTIARTHITWRTMLYFLKASLKRLESSLRGFVSERLAHLSSCAASCSACTSYICVLLYWYAGILVIFDSC